MICARTVAHSRSQEIEVTNIFRRREAPSREIGLPLGGLLKGAPMRAPLPGAKNVYFSDYLPKINLEPP